VDFFLHLHRPLPLRLFPHRPLKCGLKTAVIRKMPPQNAPVASQRGLFFLDRPSELRRQVVLPRRLVRPVDGIPKEPQEAR
jgi:hypothetical protein